ncbi:LOB domain-containing protein 15-like [Panicum miliaceum]|uniref:LOB domain-containing protein 15-like n=1 Tax=Panicum miliaceum TaxID=4540 RepID=A0A3L6R2X9_PANMI|nr:LOB domain-containing protein 15-like [Panicum miliaceum]
MSTERERLDEIGKKIKREPDTAALALAAASASTAPADNRAPRSLGLGLGGALNTDVAEGERADAASSLVYEANLRLRDPVYGCMGAISVLQQEVNALEAELEAVRAEILKHRYRQAGAGAGLVDDARATASFAAPAPAPVHAGDVVSVVEAGQEVACGGAAGAPGMSASSAVYVAEAEQQPSSTTDHYSSLNPSEHAAYFG